MMCEVCGDRAHSRRRSTSRSVATRRCLVCQGKKVGRQETKRQRHGAKEAALLQRYRPDLVLALEVGLAELAAEMRQWPATWQVDQHGTGNNPHVYLPAPRGAIVGWHEEGDAQKFTWNGHRWSSKHQHEFKDAFDLCPCGRQRHEDFETWAEENRGKVKVTGAAEIKATAADPSVSTIAYMLDGLLTRDVQ